MTINEKDIDQYWQNEFYDIVNVMKFGHQKHGNMNWLEPNGNKSSFKQMHDSMFHHLAESYSQGSDGLFTMVGDGADIEYITQRLDEESLLDPLLHLACRAMMCYTRIKRNIRHKDDSGDS